MEPVLVESAEAARLWAFGAKYPLFPPETTFRSASAPQQRAYPCGTVPLRLPGGMQYGYRVPHLWALRFPQQ